MINRDNQDLHKINSAGSFLPACCCCGISLLKLLACEEKLIKIQGARPILPRMKGKLDVAESYVFN